MKIDERSQPTEFGTEGALWHWQDGGVVDLTKGSHSLALHDLTGFDGTMRCDSVEFRLELRST